MDISAKFRHICAISTQHKLACWGFDLFGETLIPNQISNEYVLHVAAGQMITCILIQDKYRILCWGTSKLKLNNRGLIINQIGLWHS